MGFLRASFFVFVFSGLAAPAAAQRGPVKAPADKASAPAPRPAKTYVFSGDELEGELQAPSGDELTARTGAGFGSLIRVRTTFLPEIARSAEDVRR